MKTEKEIISSLPKIELHLHLDCSLSFDVVKKLRPNVSEMEYKEKYCGSKDWTDLAEALQCAIRGIALMQTEEGLREVVKDLFVQLKPENVVYAEMRFAPLLHLDKGLAAEDVVEIVAESVRESIHSTGIKAGVILCTLRHYSEEQSLQTIRLVERMIGKSPVVGFDIASDEAGFPIDAHKKAFEYAIKKDIPRTAHAGEGKGADSVWETLKYFKPHRIGHGVRSAEDEALVEFLVKNDIHLEICPTSNVLTRIYKEYSDHSVDFLFKSGVSVGINSDSRALVNVSLTEEYEKLADTFGWGVDEFMQCNLNALSHAFISQSEKEALKQVLLS